MNMEGIILSQIAQRKTNKHGGVYFLNNKTQRNRVEWWLSEALVKGNAEMLVKGQRALRV